MGVLYLLFLSLNRVFSRPAGGVDAFVGVGSNLARFGHVVEVGE